METSEIIHNVNWALGVIRVAEQGTGHSYATEAAEKAHNFALAAQELSDAAYQLARLAEGLIAETQGAAMESGAYEGSSDVRYYSDRSGEAARRATEACWDAEACLHVLCENALKLHDHIYAYDGRGAQ